MSTRRELKNLREYLNRLSTEDQAAFAQRCGTSVGFLRKAISIDQDIGEKTAIAIERETGSEIRCEGLRPDVDWQFLRNTA